MYFEYIIRIVMFVKILILFLIKFKMVLGKGFEYCLDSSNCIVLFVMLFVIVFFCLYIW